MVQQYKEKNFFNLLHFLKNNKNSDFYYTENNIRNFIEDKSQLKKLLKDSRDIFIIEERGDILGVILIWKSILNNNKRYFIKINAIDKNNCDKLLTVLLWNVNVDLFVKIKKFSKFVDVFKNKGFRFSGDRGKEILLFRGKTLNNTIKNLSNFKEETRDERSNNTK